MAKKKAAAATINMAYEIRDVLTENPNLTGKEVIAAVQAKHPGITINERSAGVAFSTARKKLGIAGGRADRRKKGAKKVVRKRLPSAGSARVDLAILQAAVKFLAEVGDADTAVEAVKQVQRLQVK